MARRPTRGVIDSVSLGRRGALLARTQDGARRELRSVMLGSDGELYAIDGRSLGGLTGHTLRRLARLAFSKDGIPYEVTYSGRRRVRGPLVTDHDGSFYELVRD
jgi:hypothetical protein